MHTFLFRPSARRLFLAFAFWIKGDWDWLKYRCILANFWVYTNRLLNKNELSRLKWGNSLWQESAESSSINLHALRSCFGLALDAYSWHLLLNWRWLKHGVHFSELLILHKLFIGQKWASLGTSREPVFAACLEVLKVKLSRDIKLRQKRSLARVPPYHNSILTISAQSLVVSSCLQPSCFISNTPICSLPMLISKFKPRMWADIMWDLCVRWVYTAISRLENRADILCGSRVDLDPFSLSL